MKPESKYHETKWRTINMRPDVKELLKEIGEALGNGYRPKPMAEVMEDLVIAKHRELFPK